MRRPSGICRLGGPRSRVSSNTLRFESLGPSISVIARGSNKDQDNDGDDLVDCADPECHEGDGNNILPICEEVSENCVDACERLGV
jgi:hypothetical protein